MSSSTSKRNIIFFAIKAKKKGKAETFIDPKILLDILDYTYQKVDCNQRTWEYSEDKGCVMDSLAPTRKGSAREIIMISGQTNYRPPIRKFKNTPIEALPDLLAQPEVRENPKALDEAEEEKTHILFSLDGNEAIVLYESRKVFAFKHFLDYLRYFTKIYHEKKKKSLDFTLENYIIPRGDFLEQLEKLKRVRAGRLYMSKQVLGSSALKYSDRTEEIQDLLTLEVAAKRGRDIKELARDLFKKVTSEGSVVKKMRIEGFGEARNPVILDTDYCQMKDYIEVDLDPSTKIVKNSEEIFSGMHKMLNNFLKKGK